MAHGAEDCASVLEQFVQDVANLPAEINHLMEEVEAKDKIIQECRATVNSRDGSLQKFVRLNGSLTPNPKEEAYSRTILQNLDRCQQLQDEKIQLSEKACILLDRQIKRLDLKIRDLIADGVLSNDPPIPSLFNNKDQYKEPARSFFPDQKPSDSASFASPLHPTSGNASLTTGGGAAAAAAAAGAGAAGGGAAAAAAAAAQRLAQSGLPRSSSVAALALASQTAAGGAARNSAPATPAAAAAAAAGAGAATAAAATATHHQQRQRESSTGAIDSKRRRLNASLGTLPAMSSNLRQSSLGPGTPKGGGTPVSSRAGSAAPRAMATTTTKKAAISKKVAPHQQIRKVKASAGIVVGKAGKRSAAAGGRLKGPGRPKMSPATLRRDEDEDESLLSSAEASESEHANRLAEDIDEEEDEEEEAEDEEDEDEDEDEEDEEEEGNEDTKVYCTCRSVSHGDMVACDNDKCPYEWFHWKCVGLVREPVGTWYCAECRQMLGK